MRRAVRVPAVNRLVASSPEQFVRALVAERRDRGRAGEPDRTVVIHGPDRLRARLQYTGEEILDADVEPCEVADGA